MTTLRPHSRVPQRGTASGGGFYRLGTYCATHAWRVVAVWIVLLVAASLAHVLSGGHYSDDFVLPGSQTQQGSTALENHVQQAGAWEAPVVFSVRHGTLAQHRKAIQRTLRALDRTPHVVHTTNPFVDGVTSGELTQNGRTAYSNVSFDQNPVKLGPGYIPTVDKAVKAARHAGVAVDYAGFLGQDARPQPMDRTSELIGVAIAIVVLLIGFGSVYAAGLPILAAGIGVGTGIGILGFVASLSTFASVSPTIGTMMGLGVGIDYGLFLTTRFRQLVKDGVDPVDAAGRTVATSGRAVLVAAVTVVVAMLGLYASGIGFIGKLGVAAGITVAVGAAASLTLVPALLALLGAAIDRRTVRRAVAEETAEGDGDSPWYRYAQRVSHHPWLHLGAGLLVLVILAIPLFSMNLGHVGAGSSPQSYTERRAFDTLESGFGAGANAPMTVVVKLPPHTSNSQIVAITSHVSQELLDAPHVQSVTQIRASKDRAVLFGTVFPTTGPQSMATDQLMHNLRDVILPAALAGTRAKGLVTGSAAGWFDFRDQVHARLPLIIAVVILAAFVLLLLTFRSPLLALKAGILNLFSIGAAYGVVVAVFQWGWGARLLGVEHPVPIESYVPMMMFAIVFGLSMDYEVFLLSRVREAWVRHGDNTASVAEGLAVTARVITCAALIMASVFLAFCLDSDVVVKMIAMGLGVSVIIDASIIRLIVVPSTMFLLGRWNWWTPSWLDRWLPHLDPEGQA